MKMKIPRGNFNKWDVIMETPTMPPSIMWLGTKNSSKPNAIIIAPSETIIILAKTLRMLFF